MKHLDRPTGAAAERAAHLSPKSPNKRIRFWDKDNGDTVVYDNKPDEDDDPYAGTAIGGGNIKVHKAK